MLAQHERETAVRARVKDPLLGNVCLAIPWTRGASRGYTAALFGSVERQDAGIDSAGAQGGACQTQAHFSLVLEEHKGWTPAGVDWHPQICDERVDPQSQLEGDHPLNTEVGDIRSLEGNHDELQAYEHW